MVGPAWSQLFMALNNISADPGFSQLVNQSDLSRGYRARVQTSAISRVLSVNLTMGDTVQADTPSQTAMAAAFLRAMHPVVDDPPAVFEDPLARAFLPDYQRRFLDRLDALPRRWLQAFRQRRSAVGRMRAQIVVRARFADDALQAARHRGVARHVVLAAGLDTSAWRQAPFPVVEIDHPATQRWKRRQLDKRNQALPPSLEFLPVDFERQRLTEVLDAPAAPQFITWLGTTYYLSHDAIAASLTALAESSPAGSRLALDFWEEAPPGRDGAALLWGTRVATAMQFEPMRTFLGPARLAALARECGWQVAEHLDAEAQNRRYLDDRRDGLAVPGFAHVALLER